MKNPESYFHIILFVVLIFLGVFSFVHMDDISKPEEKANYYQIVNQNNLDYNSGKYSTQKFENIKQEEKQLWNDIENYGKGLDFDDSKIKQDLKILEHMEKGE